MLNLDSRDIFILVIAATFPVFAFVQDAVSVLPIVVSMIGLCFLEFSAKQKASELSDLRAEISELQVQIDSVKEIHEAFKLRMITGGKK